MAVDNEIFNEMTKNGHSEIWVDKYNFLQTTPGTRSLGLCLHHPNDSINKTREGCGGGLTCSCRDEGFSRSSEVSVFCP